MWILRALSVVATSVLVVVASIRPAEADTVFASQVVSYNPGSNYATSYFTGGGYTSSAAAVGTPSGVTGYDGFFGTSVVSVFSPPYDANQIVSVGEGGQLILKLPQPAYVKPGLREIGVFSNTGLVDASYPNGTATNPAQTFSDNYAQVEVSQNGTNWVSLGVLDLNMPTNYYLNAGPYDADAPANPQVADCGKPFTGTLSSFNSKTNSQIVTLLNGSAGGNWLDLSSTGLSEVQYLRFSVPDGGINGNPYACIDAVSIANGALTPVPEPATSALLALGSGLAWLLNRRRRTA